MSVLVNEEMSISISGDIARAIQRHYGKEDYSSMVENFFKILLPKQKNNNGAMLSSRLRGCASISDLVDNTDKEIKSMMYQEKYDI